jgi:DNA (cytosine-5)-methyltransferase 1
LQKEAARLQSFPDCFELVGIETTCFNQVGNAVRLFFAFHLARSVRDYLKSDFWFSVNEIEKHQLSIQSSLPL